MQQSPLSKRKKGSAQKPSSDGLPSPKSGGRVDRQGPSGSGKPTTPSGLDRSGRAASGQGSGIQSGRSNARVGSPANNSGGAPGAGGESNASRKGGTSHDYASNRGRNS